MWSHCADLKARVKVMDSEVSPLYAKIVLVYPLGTSMTSPTLISLLPERAPRVKKSSKTTRAMYAVASTSILQYSLGLRVSVKLNYQAPAVLLSDLNGWHEVALGLHCPSMFSFLPSTHPEEHGRSMYNHRSYRQVSDAAQ